MPENCWFISDLHFFHKKMLDKDKRPQYSSTEEMNENLRDQWNKTVRKNDRIYCLGDVSLGGIEETRSLLYSLNGRIYLVKGNHDDVVAHKRCCYRFVWQRDLHYMRVGDDRIMMCHYAMRSWRSRRHGSWMLFGHSHGRLAPLADMRTMDVGVDAIGTAPISYEYIKSIMDKIPPPDWQDE